MQKTSVWSHLVIILISRPKLLMNDYKIYKPYIPNIQGPMSNIIFKMILSFTNMIHFIVTRVSKCVDKSE